MAAIFETLAVTGSRKNDGTANASGRAFFYRPGTTALATIYPDATQSAPMSNPVTLNAAGKATVYFAGQVDVFIEDAASLPISTLTLSERAERVEVRNAGFTGLLPSGSQGAGGKTDLDTVLSRIFASTGGLDGKYREFTGATSRPIADKFREISVSVKDYGALGDGIVDDTSAVQTAINEVGRLGGGIVYFPAGTYNILGPLTNTLSAPISLIGVHPSVSILENQSTTAGMFSVGAGAPGFTISNLKFTAASSSTGTAIAIVSPQSVDVDNVVIDGHRIGIDITSTTNPTTPTLRVFRCFITTDNDAAARGVRLTVGSSGYKGSSIISSKIDGQAGAAVELSGAGITTFLFLNNNMAGTAGAPLFTNCSTGEIFMLGNDSGTLLTGTAPRILLLDKPTVSASTDSVSFTPNWVLQRAFRYTAGDAAVALNAPTPTPASNQYAAMVLILKNSAGATTWTTDAVYHLNTTIDTTANGLTTLWVVWDWVSSVWREIGRATTT